MLPGHYTSMLIGTMDCNPLLDADFLVLLKNNQENWHVHIQGKGQYNLPLTHSCLEIYMYLTNVIWTCHIFDNNFAIMHIFAKSLKGSCR